MLGKHDVLNYVSNDNMGEYGKFINDLNSLSNPHVLKFWNKLSSKIDDTPVPVIYSISGPTGHEYSIEWRSDLYRLEIEFQIDGKFEWIFSNNELELKPNLVFARSSKNIKYGEDFDEVLKHIEFICIAKITDL